MEILPVSALQDNFMYVLVDKKAKQCVVVDPVEPQKIVDYVSNLGLTIKKVLTTHHHWDHANGNPDLVKLVQSGQNETVPVYGGDDRIPALTNKVTHNDIIEFGDLKITCLFTPFHTTGHICYFVETNDISETPVVFTGDTLFMAGCGRLYEGTAEQMYNALVKILSNLPSNTLVYCGHEYAVENLQFALTVEPNNQNITEKLNWCKQQLQSGKPTIPSTIAEELSFNPFLRVHESSVQEYTGQKDPVQCMRVLREERDKF